MPITPTRIVKTPVADTDTPFDVTLTTAGTAEDLATVPATKKGRAVSLFNHGPGNVRLGFDGTATVADLLLLEGEAYDEAGLELSTKVSFLNATVGQLPRVRGILWSGPA